MSCVAFQRTIKIRRIYIFFLVDEKWNQLIERLSSVIYVFLSIAIYTKKNKSI